MYGWEPSCDFPAGLAGVGAERVAGGIESET